MFVGDEDDGNARKAYEALLRYAYNNIGFRFMPCKQIFLWKCNVSIETIFFFIIPRIEYSSFPSSNQFTFNQFKKI